MTSAPRGSGPFRRIALWCWYRGGDFHGYQQQQGLRTVQGALLQAFARAGLTRNPVVAGRTDRGVSARMQVLSARLERDRPLAGLCEALNVHLPDDLQLRLASDVGDDFHAAWSSSAKEYRYELDLEAAGDLEVLKKAAALVAGTRDFRVFHFKTSQTRPRTVTSVEVEEKRASVTLRFRGQSFGRHMVRMLVGALSAVARGEVTLEVFQAGLEHAQNFHCPTAPAEPLTLWSVEYPQAQDPFTADERAWNWPSPVITRGA